MRLWSNLSDLMSCRAPIFMVDDETSHSFFAVLCAVLQQDIAINARCVLQAKQTVRMQ